MFECAGPCSITLEFCRVLKIHLPQRTRKEDKTRSKRQHKRQKKRLGLSSNPPWENESFLVEVGGKDNVFQQGLMSIPIELSLDNYQTAFTGLRNVGMICRTKSAPMSILGSTIGAAGNDFIFLDDDGRRRIIPRINSKCRQGMDGFEALQKKWLVNINTLIDQMPSHMNMPPNMTLTFWHCLRRQSELYLLS